MAKIKFLGGANIVGRMGMLFQSKGANLIFEYGMRPSKPPEYPEAAPPVDYAFLTHCHLDHSGMIPWLCGKYDTEVISTPSTMDVTKLLLEDSLKVADLEGYPRPFDEGDIRAAMRNFNTMNFGDVLDVAGFEVELHSAGHVPGATMYEMRGEQTYLFTGDLHTFNLRTVWGAHPVKCDTLFIEATYSGRNHPDRLKTEYQLIEKVREVVERGGRAILPAFAVGRTQELMMILKELKYSMWVDGMGKTVNRLYLDRPEFLRSAKQFGQAKRRFREVRTPADRKLAKREADVIVTTGGMLDGGPVMNYLEAMKDDPKSAILLSGFQVEGSNGNMLMNQGMLNFQVTREEMPQQIKVQCEVRKFDLSAHADHRELLSFIRACDPEKVLLMHSDNREPLAADLRNEGYEVTLPMTGEELEV